MLKMFTTQLTGVFKRLYEKEEFSFEDGARLLAQGPIGDGTIYIFGAKEMKGIEFEAVEGAEPLKWAKRLNGSGAAELGSADRALLFSRTSDDEEAVKLAGQLQEHGIPFVAVSTVLEGSSEGGLADLADVHIDLGLKQGLLPDDFGSRYGYPSPMAGLFVYYGLKFTIEEMLSEYEL